MQVKVACLDIISTTIGTLLHNESLFISAHHAIFQKNKTLFSSNRKKYYHCLIKVYYWSRARTRTVPQGWDSWYVSAIHFTRSWVPKNIFFYPKYYKRLWNKIKIAWNHTDLNAMVFETCFMWIIFGRRTKNSETRGWPYCTGFFLFFFFFLMLISVRSLIGGSHA